MDPFQALCELPKLVEEYKRVAAELIEVKRELEALKNDKYVTWEWICEYFGVTKPTAVAMLADEKVFVFNQKVKRLKKSAVIKFAERNSLKVKEVVYVPYKR
ncbi:hypothetical protein [Spirosoma sp. KNUC1025]|uniref:hypothetical protein n=1 Tax=Spirosoma sp. KNUC1025 TaxID=2894082 RepID=UPI00386B1A33|nr:hypothetical protein LN737_05110 [Spirosoma sp. KNUC1025]